MNSIHATKLQCKERNFNLQHFQFSNLQVFIFVWFLMHVSSYSSCQSTLQLTPNHSILPSTLAHQSPARHTGCSSISNSWRSSSPAENVDWTRRKFLGPGLPGLDWFRGKKLGQKKMMTSNILFFFWRFAELQQTYCPSRVPSTSPADCSQFPRTWRRKGDCLKRRKERDREQKKRARNQAIISECHALVCMVPFVHISF